jgi:hypothetical protein
MNSACVFANMVRSLWIGILLAISASGLSARTWTHSGNQVVRGTLTSISRETIGVRLASGQKVSLYRDQLSASDKRFIERCLAQNAGALRYSARVAQLSTDGAFVRLFTQTVNPDTGATEEQADYDNVFIRGLDSVKVGDRLPLIIWKDTKDYLYTDASGSQQYARTFCMEPPVIEAIKPVVAKPEAAEVVEPE